MASGHILVGVTGGIAAYKAIPIVRSLTKAGYEVRVVPTKNALHMVGASTWEAFTGHKVYTDPFKAADSVEHVDLGTNAIAALVVPATANFLAKYATGIADDMLTTTLLATTCPVMVAPAMHQQMWYAPATQHNVEVLRSRNITVVEPAVGALSSGDYGRGRLPEPEFIFSQFVNLISASVDSSFSDSLLGKHVVVSAGGTQEPIDPVRYLGNRSSGRQGMAIARAALAAGAQVTVVAAHCEVSVPAGAMVVSATTAQAMAEVLDNLWSELDILIMTAAVADYRPQAYSDQKLKKSNGGLDSLELVPNPDILAGLGKRQRGHRILVGFAAETSDEETALISARAKIHQKSLDYLALNQVSENTGFGNVNNTLIILDGHGKVLSQVSGTKDKVAQTLVSVVAEASCAKEL